MTIYAGPIYAGLKSIDGGQTWKRLDRNYQLLAIDATGALYAAERAGEFAPPNRLWKSTDGGASWKESSTGLPLDECHSVSSLSVSKDPNTLYAAVALGSEFDACPTEEPGGVWRSTDAGLSWTKAAAIPEGSFFPWGLRLVTDPQDVDTIYAWNERGLFKSTDAGGRWRTLDSPALQLPYNSRLILNLVIDPQNPATVYLTNWAGLFKSTDGGTTWRATHTGLAGPASGRAPVHSVVIDSSRARTLYHGTDFGVFRSTDGGANWSAVNSGLTSLAAFALTIDPSDSSTVYAGTAGGLFVIRFVP